jgi:hypothetical protein
MVLSAPIATISARFGQFGRPGFAQTGKALISEGF